MSLVGCAGVSIDQSKVIIQRSREEIAGWTSLNHLVYIIYDLPPIIYQCLTANHLVGMIGEHGGVIVDQRAFI